MRSEITKITVWFDADELRMLREPLAGYPGKVPELFSKVMNSRPDTPLTVMMSDLRFINSVLQDYYVRNGSFHGMNRSTRRQLFQFLTEMHVVTTKRNDHG